MQPVAEDIWECIRLEKLIQPEVDEIYSEYNFNNPQGIKAALRQAMWVGMCHGKGWSEE